MSILDKEFIRLILRGEKKLVPLSELKPVNVGHWEEVSVKALWPEYKDRKEVAPYFPNKICKGRTVDRGYFFNILNTFLGEELQAIIKHAHSQRNARSNSAPRSRRCRAAPAATSPAVPRAQSCCSRRCWAPSRRSSRGASWLLAATCELRGVNGRRNTKITSAHRYIAHSTRSRGRQLSRL